MWPRRISPQLPVGALMLSTIAIAACGDDLAGTYHGPQGAIVVELDGDETATVTFMGGSQVCSYDATREQVTLTCPDGQGGVEGSMLAELVGTLRRNKDGTLTSTLGVLAKRDAG